MSELSRSLSRRDFLILTGVASAAILLPSCKGKSEFLTSFSGELLDYLKENSSVLLQEYVSDDTGIYDIGDEIVQGPAIKICPTQENRVSLKAFLIPDGVSNIVTFPSIETFEFDKESGTIAARTNKFGVALLAENDLYPISIEEAVISNSHYIEVIDLIPNIFPGKTKETIKNYWPGSDYSYNSGWSINGKLYPGYKISPQTTWEKENDGNIYTLQIQPAGQRYSK